MNTQKFCFIISIFNEDLYSHCKKCIHKLTIPKGMSIEIIPIHSPKSIAKAFNTAMISSDAAYKVYLHDNVFIINPCFLDDIIYIFSTYPKTGMIGVLGSKTIPPNGIISNSTHKYGSVFEQQNNSQTTLQFLTVSSDIEKVAAIDNLIMITQVDIPWREDLFEGQSFYELAQCVECQKVGYDIVVPKQTTPWCIHQFSTPTYHDEFHHNRLLFLSTYANDIFPLVSIMITAYNRPNYLKIALESALKQTFYHTEIIINDNSTDDRCQKLMMPYIEKYSSIHYEKNKTELSVIDNFNRCLERSQGEFVCFLMDDDMYHPDKIQKMLYFFLEHPDVTLVTSFRQVIDDTGKLLPPLPVTERLFDKPTKIQGISVPGFILKLLANVIGETTTPLFRKKDLKTRSFGELFGKQYQVIADLATWLSLSIEGDIIYLPEPLSYFRIHKGQDQQQDSTIIKGCSEWYELIQGLYHNQMIPKKSDYLRAVTKWMLKNLFLFKLIKLDSNLFSIDDTQRFMDYMKEAMSMVQKKK